jgi:SlyX protein
MEKRFEYLETKLIYQEKIIEDLNGVVTTQQRQIDDILKRLMALQAHVTAILPSITRTSEEESPPPHY